MPLIIDPLLQSVQYNPVLFLYPPIHKTSLEYKTVKTALYLLMSVIYSSQHVTHNILAHVLVQILFAVTSVGYNINEAR